MNARTTISERKIKELANDWCNLIFKTEIRPDGPRLYITKRRDNALYGYIDLNTNKVHPNPTGMFYGQELERILDELTGVKCYMTA